MTRVRTEEWRRKEKKIKNKEEEKDKSGNDEQLIPDFSFSNDKTPIYSIDQNPTTERVPTIKLPTRPGNMQKLETAKLIRARRNRTISRPEHEPTGRRPNGQAHGFIFCSDNKSPTHWIKRHSKEPGSAADVKYKGLILGLQLEKDRELRTDGKNGCKHA